MRYVLGVKIYHKIEKEEQEYLCTFNRVGYPGCKKIESIMKDLENNEKVKTLVFETAEDAQKKAKELAVSYRRDDVWQKKWEKSKRIITFYPIKIDNNKFPFLVKKTKDTTKGGNYVFEFTKKGVV